MLTINRTVGATTCHFGKLLLYKNWRPILTPVLRKDFDYCRFEHSSKQKPMRLPGLRRNAVNMLKSVAYKRVEQHMEPPKYKPKRKGLSIASRLKNTNGMATTVVPPRRSFTAIAAREEKMRKEEIARKLSCIMFQPKQCSYGSTPKRAPQEATHDKPVDQLKLVHYPSLKNAQKISSTILNDLMTLDEKTKMLIYSGNKQPIPPPQPSKTNYVKAYACRPDYPKNGAQDSKIDLPQHASQTLSKMYTLTAKERSVRNNPIGLYCDKCFSKNTARTE